MKWNHWVAVALGVWLITSPWVLGFSSLNLATWNNVLVGALMVVFMLWDLTPREP
ncbi:MAG: SPW repeat protein [Patescibacteria group bacterium]